MMRGEQGAVREKGMTVDDSHHTNVQGLSGLLDEEYQQGAQLDMRARLRIKVYTVLLMQLTFTSICGAIAMMVPSVRDTLIQQRWIGSLANVAALSMIIFVTCFKRKLLTTHPHNVIFMGLFTTCMSIMIAVVCATYAVAGVGHLIVQAFMITAVATAGLTAYAIYSKNDFSWMGGMLSVSLWALLAIAIMQLFIPFGSFGNMAIGFAGAVVFSAYILYDTDKICNKHASNGGYTSDDWALASLELYLDIINLFLYILRILSSRRD